MPVDEQGMNMTVGTVRNAFLLEPRAMLTREADVATRQAKLSMLVKAAWHYDLPFPSS